MICNRWKVIHIDCNSPSISKTHLRAVSISTNSLYSHYLSPRDVSSEMDKRLHLTNKNLQLSLIYFLEYNNALSIKGVHTFPLNDEIVKNDQ